MMGTIDELPSSKSWTLSTRAGVLFLPSRPAIAALSADSRTTQHALLPHERQYFHLSPSLSLTPSQRRPSRSRMKQHLGRGAKEAQCAERTRRALDSCRASHPEQESMPCLPTFCEMGERGHLATTLVYSLSLPSLPPAHPLFSTFDPPEPPTPSQTLSARSQTHRTFTSPRES